MGLEDDEVPMPIPLPNVSGAVLQNVSDHYPLYYPPLHYSMNIGIFMRIPK